MSDLESTPDARVSELREAVDAAHASVVDVFYRASIALGPPIADEDVDACIATARARDAVRTGRSALALAMAYRACASVSELEDEDGALEKLERAAACAREAATLIADMEEANTREKVERERTGKIGVEVCDALREATWASVLQARLRTTGWPPSLRPSDLRDFAWSLRLSQSDGGQDVKGEACAVRALRALREASVARVTYVGEKSFAHDDVALAFVEDLAEELRETFATTGPLSDPRKPGRLFACAKELVDQTPSIVRTELVRVVFVEDPKTAVAITRRYLSLLVHAVSEVIQTHVCVACASSDQPWWLHVADECRMFDNHILSTPYAKIDETPKILDALVHEHAHAKAWMDAECELATSRASKSWSDAKCWLVKIGDSKNRTPRVAHDVVQEVKNAFESSKGLSRSDWRLYFVDRVATPLLEEFREECESRAVGSKGLGSLVASTGSWHSGASGTSVVAATVNACVFVAQELRVLAEETHVLEFGGESRLEAHASKFEKFNARWIEAISDAAVTQFTDKVLGNAYTGLTHFQPYECVRNDDEDEDGTRNPAPSAFLITALGGLRERVEDARTALEVTSFEKCRRAMVSKTAQVIVDRIVCVAIFSRAGTKQLERDVVAYLDVFSTTSAKNEGSSALRSKTRILEECVAVLSCDASVARALVQALRSDGIKGLAIVNALKAELKIFQLDDQTLLRVLSRRADSCNV